VCFVCTTCNPLLPNQIDYTLEQLKRFVGLFSRDKSGSGCFKCSKNKMNSSTMASHAEHVKGAEHQAAWLLLLRWRAAQIVRARPKNRLGFTRKREGVDPNTQSLSSCWDLKSHAKLQKLDPRQVKFVRDLVLLIAKALVSISLMQNKWFQRELLRQSPSLTFPTRSELRHFHIPLMRKECYSRFVKPVLDQIDGGWETVDLYMSLPEGDIMSQIFHFIAKKPVYKRDLWGAWVESGKMKRFKGQVTVDLGCETFPITNGAAMAPKVLKVMERNHVVKKVMGTTYDGGKNLGRTCKLWLMQLTRWQPVLHWETRHQAETTVPCTFMVVLLELGSMHQWIKT
jgi:hypothetical protein